MKAVVAAFNQEKALVGAFSVITNIRMEPFQALPHHPPGCCSCVIINLNTFKTNLANSSSSSIPHTQTHPYYHTASINTFKTNSSSFTTHHTHRPGLSYSFIQPQSIWQYLVSTKEGLVWPLAMWLELIEWLVLGVTSDCQNIALHLFGMWRMGSCSCLCGL